MKRRLMSMFLVLSPLALHSVAVHAEISPTQLAGELEIAHSSIVDISATAQFRICMPGLGPEGAARLAPIAIVDGTGVKYATSHYPVDNDLRDVVQLGIVDYVWFDGTAKLAYRDDNLLPPSWRLRNAHDFIQVFSPTESKFFRVRGGPYDGWTIHRRVQLWVVRKSSSLIPSAHKPSLQNSRELIIYSKLNQRLRGK